MKSDFGATGDLAIDKQHLPAYAAELDAFHRAHRPELQRVIDDLPLADGQKVLDIACGDGVYSRWLARRVGPTGLVLAVDALPEYLALAAGCDKMAEADYLSARIEALPFDDASFDLVWCAHSLISLAQPVAALEQMRRVTRPGGYVIVMENDSLHQLILPWPERLELAVRQAELQAYRANTWHPNKRYAGRRLRSLLQSAGLVPLRRRTYSVDRYAPLNEAELQFLEYHFGRLRQVVWPFLESADRTEFDRLTAPSSPDYLVNQSAFEMTWLDVVCWSTKPGRTTQRLPRTEARIKAPAAPASRRPR